MLKDNRFREISFEMFAQKSSGTCVRKIDVTYIWKQNCITESNKNVINQENNVDSEH